MDRWWAPEGPGVGVTASDLVLLEPGEDPQYDLGASLFAVHRIGAAACQMVAETPLLSDRTLVEYLAIARESYAPVVVESISKSLGDARYAGLLVRDVADAAERGALDLFRTAVAKGVTPPLAAARVGMVYGVPGDRMGAYKSLACTPAANPVALQDAADRALFAYVESLTAEEMAAAKINSEVAKADFKEEEHPRASTGRFAVKDDSRSRIAALLKLRSQVKEAKEVKDLKEVEPKPLELKQRKELKERKEYKEPKQALTLKPSVQRKSYQRPAEQRLAMQRKYQRTPEQIKALQREPITEVVRPGSDKYNEIMAQLPTRGDGYGPMDLERDQAVSVFLDRSDFYALREAAKDTGGKFRIGHVAKDGNVTASQLHESSDDVSNRPAAAILSSMSFEDNGEWVFSIADDDPEYEEYADLGDALIDKYEEYLDDEIDPERREFLKQRYVSHMQDRTDPSTGHYVFSPQGFAVINELRIAGTPRGSIDGGYDNKDYVLDPNQAYEFTGDSYDYWDATAGANVVVHMIRPADKFNTEKNDVFERTHNRDAKGEFAVKDHADEARSLLAARLREGQAKVEEAKAPKQLKQAKEYKAYREPKKLREQHRAEAKQRKSAQRKAVQRTPEQRKSLQRLRDASPMETFGPGQHIVMSGYDWRELLDIEHLSGSGPAIVHVNDPDILKMLREASGHDGDSPELGEAVLQYHSDDLLDASDDEMDKLSGTAFKGHHQVIRGQDVEREVKRYARAYFDMHPKYTDLEIRTIDDPARSTIRVEVRGFVNKNAPVVVRNEVSDWNGPLKMQLIGPSEQKSPIFNDVAHNVGYVPPTELENPMVTLYSEKVNNLKVDAYHYVRPGHMVYALQNRNTPGQKPGEAG